MNMTTEAVCWFFNINFHVVWQIADFHQTSKVKQIIYKIIIFVIMKSAKLNFSFPTTHFQLSNSSICYSLPTASSTSWKPHFWTYWIRSILLLTLANPQYLCHKTLVLPLTPLTTTFFCLDFKPVSVSQVVLFLDQLVLGGWGSTHCGGTIPNTLHIISTHKVQTCSSDFQNRSPSYGTDGFFHEG